ncbi:hypothetical protein FFX79_02640 [Staphylococcus aureus]|nr:hypothetical protein FORC59_2483 [Staphylococcus aureus]MBG0953688.1 hypothetical protein [Staphylococcus aureus]TLG76199.1 hypothetical protein FEZ72_02640 [Staphylococcus aureus]TLV28926.1 hypothetical protein FFY31_02620 [Staphylococcus aureus]TLV61992.1 hypothetical protein FFY16_01435 [Staphylococcus aureus]
MQVGGAPTKKLAESQPTIMCKLGWDDKEKLNSQFLQTMQVGVGRRNKFCENIISVPLPLAFTKFKCAIRIYV